MNDPWTRTMVRGLSESWGAGWTSVKGGKWDNFNIINNNIKIEIINNQKEEKNHTDFSLKKKQAKKNQPINCL